MTNSDFKNRTGRAVILVLWLDSRILHLLTDSHTSLRVYIRRKEP